MKNYCYSYIRLNIWILVLATFFLHSCSQKSIPPEFVGQWRTEPVQITVRTEFANGDFAFISGPAYIVLIIKTDNTADGSIGSANF